MFTTVVVCMFLVSGSVFGSRGHGLSKLLDVLKVSLLVSCKHIVL